jgi:hypothetical protein
MGILINNVFQRNAFLILSIVIVIFIFACFRFILKKEGAKNEGRISLFWRT